MGCVARDQMPQERPARVPALEGLPRKEAHEVDLNRDQEAAVGAGQGSHLGCGRHHLAALLQLGCNPEAACQQQGHAHHPSIHHDLAAAYLQWT